MKAIIAGGGTGGHLFPGVAVAREILRREPDAGILFTGAERGIEKRVVPREGFELETLPIGGIKGVGFVRCVKNLFAMTLALVRALGVLGRFDPDVVVGVGGYASFPVVGAAILRGIPRGIMEQNVCPGLANRVLGRRVDFAAVTHERTAAFFPGKAVVTGNPVRAAFKEIEPKASRREPFTILIVGGSQGAEAINRAAMDALDLLEGWKGRIRFFHQSGERQLEEVRSSYRERGFEARVESFLDDIDRQYAASDLIVSRAGGTTVAELKASGRAAILVPLPSAALDQPGNAKAMADGAAAVMIDNARLTGKRLAEEIMRLLEAPENLTRMETNARKMAVLDAESRIVDLMEQAAARRRK